MRGLSLSALPAMCRPCEVGALKARPQNSRQSAPDFFTTDTPTAVLVRQVLGAVSQFEKANLVAKLRAARERKIAAGGRGSGRFAYAQKVPEVVALVHELHGQRQSLRQISKTLAAHGHLTGGGRPYTATAVQKMLRGG